MASPLSFLNPSVLQIAELTKRSNMHIITNERQKFGQNLSQRYRLEGDNVHKKSS